MNTLPTPKMSEILKEEFLNPLGISGYRLAQAIGVPYSRMQAILNDQRKVTADTSIRLGRYLSVSDDYFLKLQTDIDVRNAELENRDNYNDITSHHQQSVN